MLIDADLRQEIYTDRSSYYRIVLEFTFCETYLEFVFHLISFHKVRYLNFDGSEEFLRRSGVLGSCCHAVNHLQVQVITVRAVQIENKLFIISKLFFKISILNSIYCNSRGCVVEQAQILGATRLPHSAFHSEWSGPFDLQFQTASLKSQILRDI